MSQEWSVRNGSSSFVPCVGLSYCSSSCGTIIDTRDSRRLLGDMQMMSEVDARIFRYTGLTAIVTGASRGIGRAVAVRLASEGSDLVLNAFQETPRLDEVAHTCERLGYRVRTLDADLADPAVPGRLVELAATLGNGVDLVVNNAFWEAHGSVTEITLDGWQ